MVTADAQAARPDPQAAGASHHRRLSLLLVEDNNDDVEIFVDLISEHVTTPIDLSLAAKLSEAIEDVLEENFDVILLDLSLPDSEGTYTYHKMQEMAPDTPIVILTGLDDEEVALLALGEGVQDYLVKGKVNGDLLMRSIRYAIERQNMMRKLKEADEKLAELTGLLPICPSCKKVRDEESDKWTHMERYLRKYTRVKQTLCPSCARHLA